ncbi:MAG: low molecular weight phosphatase family protein [Bacteroidetes bacterium SW_9_63_38]|nr:MAG: low molecular weight phosphatase family protein [Bacteroidetes bacterium SW_9_63_38]
MRRVLFVCTHNSARSQMAEGLLNHRHGGRYEAWSAGTHPSGVSPFAVKVMKEIGIDISDHTSKSVEQVARELGMGTAVSEGDAESAGTIAGMPLDMVVTVCDDAKERCPYVPARKGNVHVGFDDPSAVEGTDEEKRAAFRRVRDALANWIDDTFGAANRG